MILDLSYSHARVTSALGWERRWLEDYLSFTTRRFSPAKGYAVEETVSMVTPAGSFPAGFLGPVRKRAVDDCVRLDVRDLRTKPCEWDASFDPAWLRDPARDYQREGVEVLRALDRGILDWPTGGGKTAPIIAICTGFHCNWLVATPLLSLVGQARDDFRHFTGEEIGQLGDGVFEPRRVTVGTFDSIRILMRKASKDARAKKFLEGIGGCFVDEVHVAASKRNRFVLSHLPRCYFMFGCSGTPLDRSDGRNAIVIGTVGPVVHKVERAALVERKVLSEGTVTLVPVRHEPYEGVWVEVQRRVTESEARMRTTVAVVKASRRPVLMFVERLEHGQRTARTLRAAGVPAEFTWGAKDTAQRREAIRSLVHGDIEALVTNRILKTGINIPELRTIVYGGGGKAVIAQLQGIGRGSRVAEDKSTFDIFDILDQGCGCSGKHRSCRWLESHARKRRATYLSQGYSVVVRDDLSR